MIGDKTKAEAEGMLQSLFNSHWGEIKEAYSKSDETGLNISLSVGMKERDGTIHLKTNISFISDRVKDELSLEIDEKQLTMPGINRSIQTGKGRKAKENTE